MSVGTDNQFQKAITGSFTAAAQTLDLSSPNSGTSIVQLTGTWAGTILVEVSNDNSTYIALGLIDASNNITSANITANGIYIVNTNGYQYIRARASVLSSGTANLTVWGADANTISYSAQTGTWIISSITNPVAVTGTFWQATQPVSVASLPLPSGAATSANQTAEQTLMGAVTETAPASDTASSGLNGRLQRIAQRLTSLIALIPTVNTIAWFTRISDGTNNLVITANGDASVSDGLSGGGVHGNLSVPTLNTPVEVKVGGSRLANRKLVTFQATDADFYWGYSNTVTTSSGTKISRNATAQWSIDPAAGTPTQIWVVCGTSSKNGRVTESP